jgi:hypothetical protein
MLVSEKISHYDGVVGCMNSSLSSLCITEKVQVNVC